MFDRANPPQPAGIPPRRPALGVCEMEDRVVPTLLGQQLFPADNAWNQDVSAAPVDPNSAAIIANIGTTTRVTPDWGSTNNNLFTQQKLYGIPVNIVHGNGANVVRTNVVIDNYPGESDIVSVPLPTTFQPVLEGDLPTGPNTNGPGYSGNGQRGDSHLIIWDEDNNVAYELFGASRPSDPNLFPNTSGVELPNPGGWHAAQETVWDMKTNEFRTIGYTSADGAGLSILAGLVRPDEGLPVSQGGQGVITHALRVTLNGNQLAGAFTYPASHLMNGPALVPDRIPAGGRLRLMNTPAVNNLINQMGPEAQIVARAMQQYGLIVADLGSPMYVTGMDGITDFVDGPNGINLTWNESDILASGPSQNGLEALNAGDFQVVDLTPVVTGLSAPNGSAGTTITVTGHNFSGAGGRLSVLFGGTPATTVTVVDDSHVTAVVPAGSGTVAVTVQSGINETDQVDLPAPPGSGPGYPNFTETIASGYQPSTLFGYGVSAVSPAAQFTYGLPVSSSLSTAGLAQSTLVSGNTDLLTITVEDTAGAAVTGLAGGAFGFGLSGGTSSGTFGPVAATGTPGTYTATFTGTTAGTASTLTVTVAGVTLASHPAVTVTTGPVSGATSTAGFATPTVAAGATDTLTITVRDAGGNAVGGLAAGAFQLGLSVGTTTGAFGPVTQTGTPGTYTAVFTGGTPGTASTLTVHVNGVQLATQPTIRVTPLPISGTNSTASFAAPAVTSGSTDVVTIVVRDTGGAVVSGLTTNAFLFVLSGASTGSFGTVVETGNPGTYTAVFTGGTAGAASSLSVKVSGVQLSTQPTIQVTAPSLPPPPPPGSPGPVLVGSPDFAVGADAGGSSVVTMYNPGGSAALTATPFPGFAGGIRTAVGDFNGDGTPDLVAGTGPGTVAEVKVLDGKTGAVLLDVQPFATFTGGVFVAAGDVTGDGKADLVVTPDLSGGPRVEVYRGGDFKLIANFFGIADPNFRGGARAAVGDLNGDGFADLVISAGFGGGPRVSIYDGKSLSQGQQVHPVPDFFLFEPTLRNGAYVAVGDVDGDGFADLIGGGGPGGGPRVLVISGRTLLNQGSVAAMNSPVANFFAGNPSNRGGVRVAVKNLDGDEQADVVTGSGTGGGSRVTAYLGKNVTAGVLQPTLNFDAFPGFNGGVFVG